MTVVMAMMVAMAIGYTVMVVMMVVMAVMVVMAIGCTVMVVMTPVIALWLGFNKRIQASCSTSNLDS